MKELIISYILKKFINYSIKFTPSFLLRFLFMILYRVSKIYTIKILRQASLKKLDRLKCNFINKSSFISSLELKNYRHSLLAKQQYESIRTPDIFDISKNNFLTLNRREISLYLFENASFSANSDIITLKNKVYWEKANRKEFSQMIPLDQDFINVDYKNKLVYHISQKKKKQYNTVFSLCGVHVGSWGHFLLNFLPKLITLSQIDKSENAVIIIPNDIHSHNKEMVNLFLKANFNDLKMRVESVESDVTIQCKKLYYCNTISFLSDSGYIIHPASACISKYGSEVMGDFLKYLHSIVPKSFPKKIYIGRGPKRNLTNASEVEDFFIKKGFEIIYPHLLTLEQKIDIFGNATHICGPVSSGFTNFIFCKNKVKILGFFNYARAFDPFLSGLNFAGGLNHDILFVTGYETPSPLTDNSYYIDLETIKSAAKENSFWD